MVRATKAKPVNRESTIPTPIVVLLVLVAAGMAGGGLHQVNKDPGRSGTFKVSYEWHLIDGGVHHQISQNRGIIKTPPKITVASSLEPKVYTFRGHEHDHIVASMKALSNFKARPTSSMFVTIIFYPDGGMPALPAHSRDANPTKEGVITIWPRLGI